MTLGLTLQARAASQMIAAASALDAAVVACLVRIEDTGLGGQETLDGRFCQRVDRAEVDVRDQVVWIEDSFAQFGKLGRGLALGEGAEGGVALRCTESRPSHTNQAGQKHAAADQGRL